MKRLSMDNYGSAISFIIGILVIGLVVAGVIGSFAWQFKNASDNGTISQGSDIKHKETEHTWTNGTYGAIPGGPALLLVIALLFIIIPVIVFARKAM